jgi:phenylacetate-CoA ligase
LIEPGQLQSEVDRFVSTAQPRERYSLLLTGGSSGDPRPVYHDRAEILQNAVHGERERCQVAQLVGRRFGYRETILISRNSTAQKLQGFTQSQAFLPRRLAIQRQYLSLLDSPQRNIPLINEFEPDVIHTYGSYLEMIFVYLLRAGPVAQKDFHRPKVVTYSSDGLSTRMRKVIEEQFGIPVLTTYQASEALKIGFDCSEHQGIHLNIDLYPVRVVDAGGHDMPRRQTGEVVISNLVNKATVLLNYRLGDLAAMLPDQCPCGRTLPLLSYPPGRQDDLILLPSGETIHPQVVRTMFTVEREVLGYQIVQKSDMRFDVRIITVPGADLPPLKTRVESRFGQEFGLGVQAEVHFVDSIDRTVGGKFRPVISMCAPRAAQEDWPHVS